MQNVKLDEAQAGIKLTRRNINNLRYADDIMLMAENEEELKSLLMRVKEESEKGSLKLNIKKPKIHDIWPHYFMENRRGKGGSSNRFSLLGSKITTDDDCRHEIRRQVILGWNMTNLVCVCVCV